MFCSEVCMKQYNRQQSIIRANEKLHTCKHCNNKTKKVFCSFKCYIDYMKTKSLKLKECPICHKQFYSTKQQFCSKECVHKLSSIRMHNKNPMRNLDTKNKMKESLNKLWRDPEKLKQRLYNFMNAPKYRKGKITKPEQIIIDFKIDNLVYTGNGTRWVTFKTGKHKNPDFTYSNSNKVVEVGDFEFWHTQEEKEQIIKAYNDINIACLYLDSKDVITYPDKYKEIIVNFLCE